MTDLLPSSPPTPVDDKAPREIHVHGEYYIHASALALAVDKRAILHGETFLVCDRKGGFPKGFQGEIGLFHKGTRYLSVFEESLGHDPFVVLNISRAEDRTHLMVELTNSDFEDSKGKPIYRSSFALRKKVTVLNGVLYVRYHFRNFLHHAITFPFHIDFASDFQDIFEVRGVTRAKRGTSPPPVVKQGSVLLRYKGLDKVGRFTTLQFSRNPKKLSDHDATFLLTLPYREEYRLDMMVSCSEREEGQPVVKRFAVPKTLGHEGKRFKEFHQSAARYYTNNESFNNMINQSMGDLWSLLAVRSGVRYPLAGIPWFSAPFGRDGLITAYEALCVDPTIARDTLTFLAKYQGKKVDKFTEEEPGRILHELREGEMATLREIPFIPYYGSVDATLLFLVVMGKYVRWTGDIPLLKQLWEHVERALEWAETYGDRDEDGYVEYRKRSPLGLAQQGWKDSHNAIIHQTGKIAESPIALVEVQAYLYAARLEVAWLAELLGKRALAARQRSLAARLKRRFYRSFWDKRLGFLGLALDKRKRLCRVVSSNPGHALWTGILDSKEATRVGTRLMQPDMMSGWGVRTLSKQEKAYNPMGYHLGCIWPHDNAILLEGLRKAGLTREMKKLATVLFESSLYFPGQGLPEVYCGFDRVPQHGPTPYPVACTPQAWSAAAVFLMLKAMMGVTVDAVARQIVFEKTAFPEWLDWIEVEGMSVGEERIDFKMARADVETTVDLLRKPPGWKILVVK